MHFGQRIKRAREAAGFTQEGLAREIGVTSMTISNYERGKVPDPRSNHIVAIATACHTTVSEILEGGPPAPPDPDRPGEQDADVLWAAGEADLDASGIRTLRGVRRDVGPMTRSELLVTAERIAANTTDRSGPTTPARRRA